MSERTSGVPPVIFIFRTLLFNCSHLVMTQGPFLRNHVMFMFQKIHSQHYFQIYDVAFMECLLYGGLSHGKLNLSIQRICIFRSIVWLPELVVCNSAYPVASHRGISRNRGEMDNTKKLPSIFRYLTSLFSLVCAYFHAKILSLFAGTLFIECKMCTTHTTHTISACRICQKHILQVFSY